MWDADAERTGRLKYETFVEILQRFSYHVDAESDDMLCDLFALPGRPGTELFIDYNKFATVLFEVGGCPSHACARACVRLCVCLGVKDEYNDVLFVTDGIRQPRKHETEKGPRLPTTNQMRPPVASFQSQQQVSADLHTSKPIGGVQLSATVMNKSSIAWDLRPRSKGR